MSQEYWSTHNQAGSGTMWSTLIDAANREILYSEDINPISNLDNARIHGQEETTVSIDEGENDETIWYTPEIDRRNESHIRRIINTSLEDRDIWMSPLDNKDMRESIKREYTSVYLDCSFDSCTLLYKDMIKKSNMNLIEEPIWDEIKQYADLNGLYIDNFTIKAIVDTQINKKVHDILKGLLT